MNDALKHPRIVVITPRFWPLTGSTASVASNLAVTMQAKGARPRIITPCWYSDWPQHVVHREVPVDRLARPGRGIWGRSRFAKDLSQWLARYSTEYDAVIAVSLDEHIHVILNSIDRLTTPVLVRVARAEKTVSQRVVGRTWWGESGRAPGRRFLSSHPDVYEELVRSGLPAEHIHSVFDGVSPASPRTAAERFAAREALAAVNHDLAVTEYAPVALYVGRLENDKGLREMIQAWVPIAQGVPSASLWLIGDGSARRSLYELAVDLGVHHQVRMPGTFDEMSGVYQAADIFVNPSPSESTNLVTLEAMAAGLPIIATNTSRHRLYLNQGRCGILVQPNDVESWTCNLRYVLENPGPARELGELAREFSQSTFCIRRYADDVLELIRRISS